MGEEKFCHSTDCPNSKRAKEELESVKKDLTDFKEYVQTKLSETNTNSNDFKERLIRLEVLFNEKLNNIERILSEKKNEWLVILGNLISPIATGIILYLLLNK